MWKRKKKCAIILRPFFPPSRTHDVSPAQVPLYSYSRCGVGSRYHTYIHAAHTATDRLDVAVIRIYIIYGPEQWICALGSSRSIGIVLLFIGFLDTARRSIRTKPERPRPSIHCSCKLVVRHREQPRYP